jgi:hypothetical protein
MLILSIPKTGDLSAAKSYLAIKRGRKQSKGYEVLITHSQESSLGNNDKMYGSNDGWFLYTEK